MRNVVLPAAWYQQFDADYARAVPAEGYGGWRRAQMEMDIDRAALVVMHAWDWKEEPRFPGWRRCVEYIPRAERILREVFPPLLAAARESGVTVLHVAGGGTYHRRYPGYQRALSLAARSDPPEQIEPDPCLVRLREFRRRQVFVGVHNEADVKEGFRTLDFPPQACPEGDEGVVEDAPQLLALCKEAGVSHLLYCGFAVNWCLLLSPGGMAEMSRHGLLCSIVRDATTAVENRESAATEQHKEEALWRVALAYGFVYESSDLIAAMRRSAR